MSALALPLPLPRPSVPPPVDLNPAFIEPPPPPPGSPLDRATGAFLGLAVGDALGATLEFTIRDAQPLHTEMTGGGAFDLPPGVWTDDTAMALCLADSLLVHRAIEPDHLLSRFLAWSYGGENSPVGYPVDIGWTTAEALHRYSQGGPAYGGSADPTEAGNGSLVRLAPVAIFRHRSISLAMMDAQLQSLTTHGAAECLDACAFLATLLVEAIRTGDRDTVLCHRHWAGPPAIAALALGSWRNRSRDEIRSTGYVVDTLEAALWSVGRSSTFEEALVTAVNLGGDADSIGAVSGQLAGALWGASAIPPRWLDRLAWRRRIASHAHALFELGIQAGPKR